nr:MarR family transcriptional regulator [Pectobacterium aquaticum]
MPIGFYETMPEADGRRRCVVGIRGQSEDPAYPVDIWFDSLKSVANVLSIENQQLLKIIAEHEPKTITELAALTGRAVSNVSRTLKTLKKYDLVTLSRSKNTLNARVNHQEFVVVINNEK